MKKNAQVELAAATEKKRAQLLARLINDHVEIIKGASKYGFGSLASRAWAVSWKAAQAAECAAKCESPLEVDLLGELLCLSSPPPSHLCPLPMVEILAQSSIGDYRVDFLIQTTNFEDKPISIVVEVDGHEFHEKTKEQARRDKERDRFLTASGYVVMRFTGSEVYKNAGECAQQIGAYIEKIQNNLE